MYAKGARSRCELVENVKDNYYARIHRLRYHREREPHFSKILTKVNGA